MTFDIQSEGTLTLGACLGHLVLLAMVLLRGTKPLKLPLALLSLDLFAWNFATLAYDITGQATWHYLDVSLSPLTVPLMLHIVLAFRGDIRRRRLLLGLVYAFFGTLSASTALAAVAPVAAWWANSPAWAALLLGAMVPVGAYAIWGLVATLRTTADREERRRAKLLLAAVLVGCTLGSTDPAGDVVGGIPSLSSAGTLAATMLVGLVLFRYRLFDGGTHGGILAYGALIGFLGLLGFTLVLRHLNQDTAPAIGAVLLVALGLVIGMHEIATSTSKHRRQKEHLAFLGRMSAQLSHDLRNPLAALKGAVQIQLVEAKEHPRANDDPELLELMLAQVVRMEVIIDRYHRLTWIRPKFEPTSLNDLVESVLGLDSVTQQGSVGKQLAKDLPSVPVDPDLVSVALENLIRNARQAVGTSGKVTVVTRALSDADQPTVLLAVVDSGKGMNPRQRELAFEPFHSTTEGGTGLGLPFVEWVMTAHGGRVELDSQVGVGTTVTLHFSAKTVTTGSSIGEEPPTGLQGAGTSNRERVREGDMDWS